MKYKKEFYALLLTVSILLIATVFFFVNRAAVVSLFYKMIAGVSIVEEEVLELGVVGVLAISLLIIVCFFVPVISSVPVQIVSVVSYGLPFGIAHVLLSVFIASQLAFLFMRSARVFHSPRRCRKREKMEEKIRNSSRSILCFLLLAYLAPFVPFLLIHMVAAQSGMKWWKYSLVTFLGPIPDVVVTLWLGEKITTATSPFVSYLILMIIIACVILALIYKDRMVDWIFKPRKEGEQANGE